MSENNDTLASGGDENNENLFGPEEFLLFGDLRYAFIEPTNAELALIRIRVIALENLVIALLAEASDRQLQTAREMATHISPRPGFTQHPIIILRNLSNGAIILARRGPSCVRSACYKDRPTGRGP